MSFPTKSRNSADYLFLILFFLVLTFSYILRSGTFYLPHNHGDQIQYLGLAMKLDREGFRQGYNLNGINVGKTEDGYLLGIVPAEEGDKGTLLKSLPDYYDEPLFHKPPLFKYALMLSHRIFANDNPYLAVNVNLGPNVRKQKPEGFRRAQFYAVIVPLFFSLLSITAVFLLGKMFFSAEVGLFASAMFSVSPIELMAAHRIWTDDMLSFFVAASFLVYLLFRDRNLFRAGLLSGILAGLAMLVKPSANIMILIALCFEFLNNGIFKKHLFGFICGALALSAPWHAAIYRTYGTLYHFPALNYPELVKTNPWFAFVFNRPWYMYPVNTVYQMPLYALCVLSPAKLIKKHSRDESEKKAIEFLLIWCAVFLIVLLANNMNKELRYILPVYPAIAVLSALVLADLRKILSSKFNVITGYAVTAVLFALCAFWSARIGLDFVYKNLAAIKLPL
jgi:hypothetical protein